jgi:hypothetical protein
MWTVRLRCTALGSSHYRFTWGPPGGRARHEPSMGQTGQAPSPGRRGAPGAAQSQENNTLSRMLSREAAELSLLPPAQICAGQKKEKTPRPPHKDPRQTPPPTRVTQDPHEDERRPRRGKQRTHDATASAPHRLIQDHPHSRHKRPTPAGGSPTHREPSRPHTVPGVALTLTATSMILAVWRPKQPHVAMRC